MNDDNVFGQPNNDFDTILAQRLAAHGVNPPNSPAFPLQNISIEELCTRLRNPNLHQELIDQEPGHCHQKNTAVFRDELP